MLGLKMSVYRVRTPPQPESRLTATPGRPARSTTLPLLISPGLVASTRRIVASTFGGTGCSRFRLVSQMKALCGLGSFWGVPCVELASNDRWISRQAQ